MKGTEKKEKNQKKKKKKREKQKAMIKNYIVHCKCIVSIFV